MASYEQFKPKFKITDGTLFEKYQCMGLIIFHEIIFKRYYCKQIFEFPFNLNLNFYSQKVEIEIIICESVPHKVEDGNFGRY